MAPDGGTASVGALARLTAVSRALTYAVSLDEVLDITVECAADLLGAPRVVLMLRDEDGLLGIRASLGCDDEAVSAFREPLDETLISRLSAVLGPDARERFLGVPLVVRGGVIGLLAVLSPEDRGPGEPAAEARDEWLLSALADQVSVALENAREDGSRASLETRLAELERLRASREHALRMLGHDLRNPVSALNGYLHLLHSESYGPLTDTQRTAVERLQTIALHLETLVRNVVEIGRLTLGGVDLVCEPVEVGPVAEAAVDIIRLNAGARDIELRLETPEGTRALADAGRLRQVLVQLLENAVKHAPAGSAVVLAAATEGSGADAGVAITVSDRGPGVPAEEAEAIFEAYHQVAGTGAAGEGMGLGLAIARALVTLMEGTLTLDTTVQEGATFVIRLPTAPAAEAPGRPA